VSVRRLRILLGTGIIARPLAVVVSLLVAALSQGQTGPVINAVAGAADNWSATDFGLARGSLFTIYGTNLAPSVASASALPLLTSLAGVTVTVSTNNQFMDAPLLYVSPSQINAILPSTATEGSGWVTVELNGALSNPASIWVRTSRFAPFTRSQLGYGPAVLQQYDRSGVWLNGLMHPAAPGQAVVLWGTGLGPLPSGSDADAPGIVDLGSNVAILVGGSAAKPFYAGRSPQYPGLDQINFYVPSTVPAGCYVPITVIVSGEAQFQVIIPRGSGSFDSRPTLSVGIPDSPCASEFGLSSQLLERLDQGGTVRIAALSFESQTGSQSHGGLGQTATAWLGDYDEAHLSLLATGWQSGPLAPAGFCERQAYSGPFTPQVSAAAGLIGQGVYGAPSNDATLSLKIQGADGCSWNAQAYSPGSISAESPYPDNCIASSYGLSGSAGSGGLFSVSGPLPAPRSWSPGDQLMVTSQSGGSLQATWSLADSRPDDRLAVNLSSFEDTGSIPILPTGYTQNSLTCNVSPAGNSFLVQPDDAQWAWLMLNQAASIQAGQVSLNALQGPASGLVSPAPPGAPDVVLLLIRNQLSAFSP